IAAQEQVVSARQAQADAAATEIQLRDIALKRARASQTRWEQQTDAPDADQARQLETVRLFCLNRGTALLAQAWQLLQIYEVDPDRVGRLRQPDASPLSYVPTFLVQTPTSIEMGLELLKLAQSQWNLSLLETPSPLTTIRLKDIADGLDPDVRAHLQSALTEVGGDTYPCATFRTRADLVRLIQGITFRIASLSGQGHPLPAGYPRWMSPSVYTDAAGAGLSVEEDRVPGWDDEGAFRVRLLGVLVRVVDHGGLPMNRPLKVFLREE